MIKKILFFLFFYTIIPFNTFAQTENTAILNLFLKNHTPLIKQINSPNSNHPPLNTTNQNSKNYHPIAKIFIQSGTPIGTTPLKINLTGEHSLDPNNENLVFSWEYGDGYTSQSQNPRSHTFSKPGNYLITLSVTNSSGLKAKTTLAIQAIAPTPIDSTLNNPKKKSTLNSSTQAKTTNIIKNEISKQETTNSLKSKKIVSKKVTKFKNGNLSSKIQITEIYPNPKKGEEEWIELFNSSNQDINLGNWYLDDSEKGSKPYIFSDKSIIKANSFLIINHTQSKLILNNNKDSSRLFNYQNKIISQTSYSKAPQGKSYSLVQIKNKTITTTSWDWTTPSPQKNNPIYEVRIGIIKKSPQKDQEGNLYITLEDKSKIILADSITDFNLAKTILLANSQIELKTQKISKGIYKLKEFKIISPPPLPPESKQNKIWYLLLIPLGLSLYFIYQFQKE